MAGPSRPFAQKQMGTSHATQEKTEFGALFLCGKAKVPVIRTDNGHPFGIPLYRFDSDPGHQSNL